MNEKESPVPLDLRVDVFMEESARWLDGHALSEDDTGVEPPMDYSLILRARGIIQGMMVLLGTGLREVKQ